MTHDWVTQYMQGQATKQQCEDDARLKAQHANAGAVKLFDRFRAQIQKDIETFNRLRGNSTLFYQEGAGNFRVRRANYPSVTLDVELNSNTIKYDRVCKFDETSRYEKQQGSLRIWANTQGDVQIYKNGTPFLDESEVSELLLKPVFDYIYSQ